MDKLIQLYCISNVSDGNPNIADYNNKWSIQQLTKIQTKNAICETFVDCGHQVKRQTYIKIIIFHSGVVSLYGPK